MTRRLFAAAVAALSVGVAAAAPVPKGPPPPTPKAGASVQLSTAKMNGDLIQMTVSVAEMVAVPVNETVKVNGQEVTVTKITYQTRQTQVAYQMTLKGTKATTAAGKEISEEDLPKRIGDGAAVVQVQPGFDPEWKKMFADDVIFLEPVAVAPGVPRAAPPALPGGGPALVPVQVVAPPAPPPIPLPPPVEKK